MLHSPPSPLSASNAAAPDSAPAPPVEPELGEFTRILSSSSVPPPPPPAAPPVPPPPARTAGPGEFTRMMQAPLASEPLRPAPKAQSHGISEFDRMMQADEFEPPPQDVEPSRPPEAPPARFMAAPSEFTRIFATEPQPSESLAASAPPPTPLPQGGAATGAFSRRSVAPARAADSGPSEFTRMFATPQTAAAAKTPAPMPASPPKADQSYMRLVLILAGLFLLIVVVIAVFAVIK